MDKSPIEVIIDSLARQAYVPSNIVFSNSNRGRVIVYINHVTTDRPTVYFKAYKAIRGINFAFEPIDVIFYSLKDALAAIGL